MLFIVFLIVLVCVLLVVVVLAQNAKGGGLATGMGGASQVMGSRRTADITEKATWILASTLFVLCLTMNVVVSGSNQTDNSDEFKPTTTAPVTTPDADLTPSGGEGDKDEKPSGVEGDN